MSVTDNILKTIDYAIDKKTKHLLDMDIAGIIEKVGPKESEEEVDDSNVYTVLINGEKYTVPNGSGLGFKRGDLVWVHSPNGDFTKKFIISTRTPNSKSYTNEGTGSQGEGGSISPDDIITNQEIDAMF